MTKWLPIVVTGEAWTAKIIQGNPMDNPLMDRKWEIEKGRCKEEKWSWKGQSKQEPVKEQAVGLPTLSNLRKKRRYIRSVWVMKVNIMLYSKCFQTVTAKLEVCTCHLLLHLRMELNLFRILTKKWRQVIDISKIQTSSKWTRLSQRVLCITLFLLLFYAGIKK